MNSWVLYLSLSLADVVAVRGLVIATRYLRRRHPGHVSTVWYAFWLMFTLFSLLFFYIWAHASTISRTPLSGSAPLGGFAVWFQGTSMSFSDEGYLIASIYIATLLPQLMSFLISGIFGCAIRLRFVEDITAAMTWLGIKFLAVLAGILMAQAVAALYARPILEPGAFPLKFLESVMMISLSFIVAGIFYFTYEYRHKRELVKLRKRHQQLFGYLKHMKRYSASAEAREAKKIRYARLRARLRKWGGALLWG